MTCIEIYFMLYCFTCCLYYITDLRLQARRVQTRQKLRTVHSNDVVTSDRILFPQNYSNGDSMFSRNDCTSLPDYTASQTRTHRHRSPAAPPYQTQHIPLLSRKTHAEHDHKTLKFYITVSKDEHLGLMGETKYVQNLKKK